MKKTVLCFLFLFIPGLTALSAASSGDDMFSYIPYSSASWNSKTTTESSGGVTTMDQAVKFKGKKMRMEGTVTVNGKETDQLMLMTTKYVYMIDKTKKSGTKFSMNSTMNPEKYKSKAVKYRKTAKKVGSESVNGVPCDIYAYSYEMEDGGEPMKIKEWRAKDGFVYKTSSEWKETKTSSVISNLKKNPALADSLFEPAADIQIVDMDNMMKGAFTAPSSSSRASARKTPVAVETEDTDTSSSEDIGEKAAKDAVNSTLKGMFGQ